ncbi:hypothetical protein [Pantoea sp. OXWO6B1]|uniref:hypothetical protein n=1 Tax=Pantoea sp. OXWO6B1 TaxID=1835724 RepID=UPI0007C7DD12|nr:hypothetical protein [Pantoea sp. OXWO6B1]OAE07785.1 hypothetical protein A6A26_09260 [Pantoea sp. OXWO6B1]
MRLLANGAGARPQKIKKEKGLSQIKASAAAVAQSCQLVSEIKRKKIFFRAAMTTKKIIHS